MNAKTLPRPPNSQLSGSIYGTDTHTRNPDVGAQWILKEKLSIGEPRLGGAGCSGGLLFKVASPWVLSLQYSVTN